VAVADHIIRLAVDQQHRTAHLSDQLAVGIPGTDAGCLVSRAVV
jgi:bacterioferritin-associated ferredoxin